MGQCEDDIKIPFPVVHSILIRRKCISCIFWLVERQIRDKKLQLKCGWCVKTTSWITPYNLYSRGCFHLKLWHCLLLAGNFMNLCWANNLSVNAEGFAPSLLCFAKYYEHQCIVHCQDWRTLLITDEGSHWIMHLSSSKCSAATWS